MSNYFQVDYDLDDVLQGDIFEVGHGCDDIFEPEEKYAVLITADCDIANNKMGRFFTLLPIISAQCYLREIWIKDLFGKELDKIYEELCDFVNKSVYLQDGSYNPLKFSEIKEWLEEDGINEFVKSLEIGNDKKIEDILSRYNLVSGEVNIENYLYLMRLRNKKITTIKKDIESSIKNSREEYYFIPDLPSSEFSGHMIKLRDVRAVPKERVFKNSYDLRLSPKSPDISLLRVGRFSDYLKYSITQNFAHVFSSIGMKDLFESDTRVSLDLISSEICDAYE